MYICGAGPWPRGSVSRRRLSHCDGFWAIPKGAKVGRQPVGRVPLTSMQGASEWRLGSQGCERLEISLVRIWRTGSGIKPTGMLCRENRETERRGGEVIYYTSRMCAETAPGAHRAWGPLVSWKGPWISGMRLRYPDRERKLHLLTPCTARSTIIDWCRLIIGLDCRCANSGR